MARFSGYPSVAAQTFRGRCTPDPNQETPMIQYLDLKAQYRSIKPEIDGAINRVVESGQFVLGSEVAAFEERFAAYCGAPYCTALNSGTSALHLALLAAGIGAGDEVITVSMTFVATTAAILYCSAKPVFVDIDPDTWTIDPNLIEAAVTPRTQGDSAGPSARADGRHGPDHRGRPPPWTSW